MSATATNLDHLLGAIYLMIEQRSYDPVEIEFRVPKHCMDQIEKAIEFCESARKG